MAAGADHVSQLSLDASLRVWTLWSLSFPLKLFQDWLVAGRAMLLSQEGRSQPASSCVTPEKLLVQRQAKFRPSSSLSLSLSLSLSPVSGASTSPSTNYHLLAL